MAVWKSEVVRVFLWLQTVGRWTRQYSRDGQLVEVLVNQDNGNILAQVCFYIYNSVHGYVRVCQ